MLFIRSGLTLRIGNSIWLSAFKRMHLAMKIIFFEKNFLIVRRKENDMFEIAVVILVMFILYFLFRFSKAIIFLVLLIVSLYIINEKFNGNIDKIENTAKEDINKAKKYTHKALKKVKVLIEESEPELKRSVK